MQALYAWLQFIEAHWTQQRNQRLVIHFTVETIPNKELYKSLTKPYHGQHLLFNLGTSLLCATEGSQSKGQRFTE